MNTITFSRLMKTNNKCPAQLVLTSLEIVSSQFAIVCSSWTITFMLIQKELLFMNTYDICVQIIIFYYILTEIFHHPEISF